MDKPFNRMTKQELSSFITQQNRIIEAARVELALRPPVDVPFYGFRDTHGTLYGYDTFEQARDDVIKFYPDRDPEVCNYYIDVYYKTAEEVINAKTQKG